MKRVLSMVFWLAAAVGAGELVSGATMSFISDLIQRHEGFRVEAYRDTKGLLTVGFGFNLEAAGAKALCQRFGLDHQGLCAGAYLTPEQASDVFQAQLLTVLCQAALIFPTWATMPLDVQAVICDMIFEMGEAGFLGFHKAIQALKGGQWQYAADEIEDSDWAKEVPSRAAEDAVLLRSA